MHHLEHQKELTHLVFAFSLFDDIQHQVVHSLSVSRGNISSGLLASLAPVAILRKTFLYYYESAYHLIFRLSVPYDYLFEAVTVNPSNNRHSRSFCH